LNKRPDKAGEKCREGRRAVFRRKLAAAGHEGLGRACAEVTVASVGEQRVIEHDGQYPRYKSIVLKV